MLQPAWTMEQFLNSSTVVPSSQQAEQRAVNTIKKGARVHRRGLYTLLGKNAPRGPITLNLRHLP